MKKREELLELEERFWLGDAGFYERSLDGDAVMVFADPVGVMKKDAIVESIRSAARWQSVQMADLSWLQLSPDVALLTYRATAAREADAEPYRARTTSVYVRRDERWLLSFHQQMPC
jgi:hypothetical protein